MKKILFVLLLSIASCSDDGDNDNSLCSSSTTAFISELSNVSNLLEQNPVDCLATNDSLDNLNCIYSNLSDSDIASLETILSNEGVDITLSAALDELSLEVDVICN
mgnify:CR=1 FL=1|jgi:hypothetical protein